MGFTSFHPLPRYFSIKNLFIDRLFCSKFSYSGIFSSANRNFTTGITESELSDQTRFFLLSLPHEF